jgi:hypothetical protein
MYNKRGIVIKLRASELFRNYPYDSIVSVAGREFSYVNSTETHCYIVRGGSVCQIPNDLEVEVDENLLEKVRCI